MKRHDRFAALVRAPDNKHITLLVSSSAKALNIEARESWQFAAQAQQFLVKRAQDAVLALVSFVPVQLASPKAIETTRASFAIAKKAAGASTARGTTIFIMPSTPFSRVNT
ncbi:MAG: hypothetical protein WA581_18600, partial [Candidatus Acidiferrales bacterium]